MRITLIIYSLNPGGSERALSELANYFISQNHEISIITLSSPDSQPFYQLDPKIHLIQLNQTTSDSEFSFIKRFSNILKRIFCLRKTIKNINPTLVISFVDIMNITTLIATFGLKIPVIVSERTHPAYYKLPGFYNKLRELLYPRASRIIIQTQSAASYFKNLNNIAIIPNAVVLPVSIKQNIINLPKHIISVGRLCVFKGFDILIQAFANLITKYPELTLTIYGEGSERKNLEDLIMSLKLQDQIKLPGVKSNIQELLIQADLFVFPSHYEGFPNALCEAMAVGLPVIASNCSGNIDIIEDHINGRLFNVGDIDELSKIMQELIHNPEQRASLAVNAKKITEKFSPQRIYAMWDEECTKYALAISEKDRSQKV